MPNVTAEQVEQAEKGLARAKSAKGTAKSGARVEEYQRAAKDLTEVRRAFREQEEQAGRRTGFVSGDAAVSQE